jgi:hypothetical protein
LIMRISLSSPDVPYGSTKRYGGPDDLCRHRGGIMSVKRKVIIPAILSLSTAGSILAGSTAVLLTTQAPAAVAATASAKSPDFLYHG